MNSKLKGKIRKPLSAVLPITGIVLVLSILLHGALIVLSFFVPEDFLAVAFDSGGAPTGPITVPFIMALGAGFASVRGGENAASDSFGLVALSSIRYSVYHTA